MRHRLEVFRCLGFFLTTALLIGPVSLASAQSTPFTDQDSLSDRGAPETGFDDCRFRLFDAASSRAQIGTRSAIVADPYLAGTDASWWEAVTADLTRAEYSASQSSAGLQARNRAHNMRTTFGERGIDVVPRTDDGSAPAWRFAWQTNALGRSGCMQDAAPASPQANGARVTYQHDGWSEWYENAPKGLEQGFTIERRPEGEGPLLIAGSVVGGLEPRARADGAIDFIDDHGSCVIRYGELHVWDARGSELRSHLAVHGLDVDIVIDDSGAGYPLAIDPILTSPSWTVESDQAFAQLGHSVATAGDVNGDGFSDVIVGAFFFDNGQNDEGRVFVYHGSASGLSLTPNWTAEGNQADAWFGYSVATAGDVNGDGFSDVIVGAFFFDNGQTDEGRVFVYHGSASGLSPTANWTAESDQASALYGNSVATAGDVNGDGYSDVIVGAYFYDNDQTDEGRAFVYHGSASGLATSPSWTAESDQTISLYGVSAATAGDVNGDGFSDVIVGASNFDNGQTDEGRSFVYHGSGSGLSLTANWTAEGDQAGAFFGWSVATAGDVNGDGFSDAILGAYNYDNGQSNEGRAFAYHGSAAGLAATPAWTAESNQVAAVFGYSVATAGDVNGDGFADVIVGAHQHDNVQIEEGRAFVYHGSAAGLGTNPAWTAEPNLSNARFGHSVATAGDVNGDGFSDVIVGAPTFFGGQSEEGRAFVYHGAAGPPGIDAGWTAESDQSDAGFGFSVASAGDVNGDGYSDVIVGAQFFDNGEVEEGRAYVYHGSPTGLEASPAWTTESNQAFAYFGFSVASAGDVNGDGFSDVIVGARSYENGNGPSEGRAFVYYGAASGLDTSPAWTAEPNITNAGFGYSVASAGDVNGDGFSDVIVGAPFYANGETNEGGAFVYAGSAAGLGSSAIWTAESDQAFAEFGSSVATAGDVNGDGYSDVIVGAYDFDSGEANEGRAWVFHGSPFGPASSANWTAESNQVQANFGLSVATAGDVNGDGFADVIVGAWTYDNGEDDEGRAYVYHGSASGLAAGPAWIAEANQVDAFFGWSVASAGDANGDGFADVIVGAIGFDNDQNREGRAFLYYGSLAGLFTSPSWTAESNQAAADFGHALATAGDVNGDGYSDALVGANDYDNSEPGEGRAFVYYGNEGLGRVTHPRQQRTHQDNLIAHLGRSDRDTEFQIRANMVSIYGRTRLQMEHEVKPRGVLFDGSSTVLGSFSDTGSDGEIEVARLVNGLSADTQYHWRVRANYDLAKTPFQRKGPWIHVPLNGWNEADLRTAFAGTGVAEPSSGAGAPWLEFVVPNPVTADARFSYTLPERGPVRLAIYDVSGREVIVLADEVQGSGRNATVWDGRSAGKGRLSTGVYFARLEFGGRVEARKFVLAR